ncbi:MAG TPA: type II toxin-antitoxin system mRNA interferase toxin, RelE/StbE family [Anaerolineae bacterium]|nr:type II toxin-antitoxin system mRNA interferase toxin, RelE/StbE family [Anaerolineae bacterium]
MKTEFKASFTQDLRRIKNKELLQRLKVVIETIEQSSNLDTIPNLKKLKGWSMYYRVRIGDYRMGLVVDADVVTFVRFLHRKDIYRYFP